MQPYLVPTAAITVSDEVKKNRFITLLAPTCGIDAAKGFVQQVRNEHPLARHHCWAFVAGRPSDSQLLGFSDDGEPSGTAGKPILAQLMGSDIGEITAVVVRYYGGIKLGTGGLVKAYGGGVQRALKQLIVHCKTPYCVYMLACDYAQLVMVEHLLKQQKGRIIRAEYGGSVMLHFTLPVAYFSVFAGKLCDLSRGSLQLVPIQQ